MRFGIVILPQFPWPEAARRWQAAEAYGFDVAWTYDHLSWRSLADEPWQATVPTLTAAAMATSTIRLGTFVANPNFRHPVPFAKELATLDQIAGGRVVAGLGSGGTGFDAHVLGQEALSPRQRHERYVEFVEALDRLLRFEQPGSGGVSFAGDWFTAEHARMVGAPAQSPRLPVQLAANGPRGLALAARLADGWITTGRAELDAEAWWRHVGELSERFAEACAEQGRDVAAVARVLSLDEGDRYSLSSAAAFEDAVERARELGFDEFVAHWPRESGIYAGDERVLEDVAARLPQLR